MEEQESPEEKPAEKPKQVFSPEFLAQKFKPGHSGNPTGNPKGKVKQRTNLEKNIYQPPFKVVAGKSAQEVLEKNQTNIAYWLLLKAFEGNEKLMVVLANKIFGAVGGIESLSSKRLFRELTRMSKQDLSDLAMDADIPLKSVDGEIVVNKGGNVQKANANRPKKTGDV